MTLTTESMLTISNEAPVTQPDAPPDPACLADIADSLDWSELLDVLASDFALALANGEAQYMNTVGDLMGRVSEE